MSENIFKKIKRHINQWIETEYWYRFRKISFFWFDKETGKYEEHKECARELTTSTWGGDKDILILVCLIGNQRLVEICSAFDYLLKAFSLRRYHTMQWVLIKIPNELLWKHITLKHGLTFPIPKGHLNNSTIRNHWQISSGHYNLCCLFGTD